MQEESESREYIFRPQSWSTTFHATNAAVKPSLYIVCTLRKDVMDRTSLKFVAVNSLVTTPFFSLNSFLKTLVESLKDEEPVRSLLE